VLTALSASHERVPVEMRERLAVAADDIPALLPKLYRQLGPCVIVGTCNRFEVYVGANLPRERVETVLAREAGIDLAAAGSGVRLLRDTDAGRHLFRVAAGLESMVLGEHEILGQVRRAYTAAVDASASSPVLARLFHGAVRAGRRTRAETGLASGTLSVARLAAQYAAAFRPDLASARVLVVGAGDAARQAAMALRDLGATNFTIANRTLARAELLATAVHGQAVPLAQLHDALATANIVVAAAATPHPLVRAHDIRRTAGAGDALIVLDLGVPRNVAPDAAVLPGVRYWDVDDLRSSAGDRLRARREESPLAEAIIEAELARFVAWLDQRDAAPAIALLVQQAERVRRAQVERTARSLGADDRQRAQLEAMSRALVKQVLHPAIVSARRADPTSDNARALRVLFQLEGPDALARAG
jgi:glutamyl-tRNA reductase